MDKEKVILLAFQFPPYSAVGGFRWKYLVKHLGRQGVRVTVFTADWGASPQYYADHFPSADVVVLPAGFWHRLRQAQMKSRFVMFLIRFFFRFCVDPIFFKIDYAQGWANRLEQALRERVSAKENFVVVATGAPFSVNLAAARIRKKFSNVRLIQDFRDSWSQNVYRSRSFLRLAKRQQSEATLSADAIVAVSQKLLDEFTGGGSQSQGHVISNGFDDDWLRTFAPASALDLNQPLARDSKELVFTHLGSITNGRDIPFLRFLSVISRSPELRKFVRIVQVGVVPWRLRVFLKLRYGSLLEQGVLRLLPVLPQEEALRHLSKSNFALLLNSPKLLYALSTKVYEYAMMGVPVVSLNYGGEIEQFLIENRIGFSVNLNREDLGAELTRILHGSGSFQFDVSQYKYSNLARQYKELVGRLAKA